MTAVLFYIIIVVFVICGAKKEAPDAGYDFFSVGVAVFLSLWLAPLYMPLTASIPKEHLPYVYSITPVLSAAVLFGVLKLLVNKLLDLYPRLDSAPSFAEHPVTAKTAGACYGAATGYAVASMLFFALSFLPVDIPLLDKGQLAERGDRSVLAFSAKVNMFSLRNWNSAQRKYLAEHREAYKKINAPEEPAKPAPKTPSPAPAAPAPKKPAAPAPEVSTAAVPQTAPHRFASKAVNAAAANQRRAVNAAAPEQRKVVKGNYGTFQVSLPVLDNYGRPTGMYDKATFGIALPADGSVPETIEASLPHKTRGGTRRYRRKVKIDLTAKEAKFTRVGSLTAESVIKYTIVNNK